MTETLLPPLLSERNFMSSQSGNLHTYSGGLPPFALGSDAEPNSGPRHDFVHHSPVMSDMGLRYMNIPPEESRFSHDSVASRGSVYTVDSNVSNPPSATFSNFSNVSTVFPNVMGGSTAYLNTNPSYYSQSQSGYCMSDIKPAISFISPPNMAPPHRSPHLPQLGNSVSTRELYITSTPQLRRSEVVSRTPPAVPHPRGSLPLSPSSSSGFPSPAVNMENQSSNATPPLLATEVLYPLQTSDGQPIRPDIHAKIDKGFFLEGEWTCYRRNYFSLSCSYSITPHLPMATIHLVQAGSSLQVYAFAMSIAAVVDGSDGKAIELVQHTPKRDKGPQNNPDRVTLAPRPPLSLYANSAEGSGAAGRSIFDGSYPPNSNPNQPQTETTFERIQFKQATANNGKRRAAQQYYHLLVELYADVGPQMGDNRWIKVAQRVSVQMVVRGRSPGHYQSERRGSNASAGPSGSGGKAGDSGSYTAAGGFRRSAADQGGSAGSTGSGSGYSGSYDARYQSYLPTAGCIIEQPLSPILSAEDIKQIEEPQGYTYNPFTLYEGQNGSRLPTVVPGYRDERAQSYYQLPGIPNHMESPKVKHESYSLPALPIGTPQCGRWEGVPSSRGYIPSNFSRNEVNTS